MSRRQLWIGLLLAPSAWLAGELGGYYVAARSCEPALGVPFRGTSHAAGANLLVEGIALLVAAAGLYVAAASWRATRSVEPGASAAAGRTQFMATTGVVVSTLFTLGIVLFGLSSFVVNACSQAP